MKKFKCTVCGYIHEGDLPEGFKCPLCKAPVSKFVKIEEAPAKNPYAGTKEIIIKNCASIKWRFPETPQFANTKITVNGKVYENQNAWKGDYGSKSTSTADSLSDKLGDWFS